VVQHADEACQPELVEITMGFDGFHGNTPLNTPKKMAEHMGTPIFLMFNDASSLTVNVFPIFS
jgi:acetoin utilization deacetylase AcuC-like enzyme